jgi:transposase InsO family protein
MMLMMGFWTFLRAVFFGSAAIALENVALRHQLLILQRSVGRPRLARWVFWVWLSRVWGSWRFARGVERMGIREVLIAPRASWQNPFAERVIGSIRRECLDHFLILNDAHLHRLLRAYLAYYNTIGRHQSLDNNCPQPRTIEPPPWGRIIAIPHVGGLHHRYQRVA